MTTTYNTSVTIDKNEKCFVVNQGGTVALTAPSELIMTSGQGEVVIYVKINDNTSSYDFARLTNSNSSSSWQYKFSYNSNTNKIEIRDYNKGYYVSLISNVQANTWYKFKIAGKSGSGTTLFYASCLADEEFGELHFLSSSQITQSLMYGTELAFANNDAVSVSIGSKSYFSGKSSGKSVTVNTDDIDWNLPVYAFGITNSL